MAIVDPLSWAHMEFGDETSFLDFLGTHDLQHRAFATTIRTVLGGATYPVLPLGDFTGPEWHDAHQLVHAGEATALAIAAPQDFRSYDLEEKEQFASWTWLHAQEHVRLRLAMGI